MIHDYKSYKKCINGISEDDNKVQELLQFYSAAPENPKKANQFLIAAYEEYALAEKMKRYEELTKRD